MATILAIAEGSSDPTASAAGGGVAAPPPLDLGALSGAAAGGPDSEKRTVAHKTPRQHQNFRGKAAYNQWS